MSSLGRKYTCYSCHTKFYDLGKPVPQCPKCGADQREAEDAPVVTSHRGRAAKVVEAPVEAPEFPPETEEAADDEEEAVLIPEEKEEEPVERDDEEEF